MAPLERNAEALHGHGIEETAASIGDALKSVIPEGIVFAPIVRTHPEFAADGNPMVTTLYEMMAIKADRPDIAEAVDRIVSWNTLAQRQQLELNVWEATQEGDQERLEQLREDQLKIDEKSHYLETFTILSVLHRFSRSYVKEHLPSYPGAAGSLEEQVRCLMGLHNSIETNSQALEGISLGQITNWRQNTYDPRELRQLDGVQQWAEDRILEIDHARKIINDVITGDAAIEYDFELPKEFPKASEVSESDLLTIPQYEVLRDLPGLDPAMSVAEGNFKSLPKSGWFVSSRFHLGASGGIDIFRFENGSFKLSGGLHGNPDRTSYGVGIEFSGSQYAHYSVTYQTGKEKEENLTHNGTGSEDNQIVELSKDMFLRSWRGPMRSYGSGSYGTSTHYEDLHLQFARAIRWPNTHPIIRIDRITDDLETLKKIIEGLGESMSLSGDDAAKLLSHLEKNDVLGEVKIRTEAEKIADDTYNKRDKVISESKDGSKTVEDYNGNLFAVEPDGSR